MIVKLRETTAILLLLLFLPALIVMSWVCTFVDNQSRAVHVHQELFDNFCLLAGVLLQIWGMVAIYYHVQ